MTETVKVKNASYAKYEEVLLRRDNLKKEAEQYHISYIREFGYLIEESFRLKVECIRKKKEIAFCQRLANMGKPINRNDLIAFIEKEMQQYYDELQSVINDVKTAKNSAHVSPMTVKKIKETYYKLAKLIHPDLHPEYAMDETILDYWNRITIAYQYNQTEDMAELEALVKMYLEEEYDGPLDLEITDIDSKILKVEEEIESIVTTNPYLYRIILGSDAAIKEKKKEYQNEIESFKKYSAQLSEVLATFETEEMLS